MHRQLRRLDRWYADQGRAPSPRSEGWRRFFVTSTTTLIAAVATLTVLHHEGIVVSLDGLAPRVGAGPASAAEPGGTYAFLAHQPRRPGEPVTYDPCRTLHVVTNDDLAPDRADGLVGDAVAEVSRVTGLTVVLDGTTDETVRRDRPTRDLARYGPGTSPVLVAWTTPGQDPGLAGRVTGLGGSTSVTDELSGRRTYLTGTISLDAPQLEEVLTRPGGRSQAEGVILHELGHVVGLAHVDDRNELMYPHGGYRTDYGPGDLTGLAQLGRGRCGR